MATDLTTLEKVRTYVKCEDTEDDAWIAQAITASSAWVRSELGRDIIAADYVYPFIGEGTAGVSLPQYPVVSIAGVTIDGTTILARPAFGSDGWVLVGDRVELHGYRFSRGAECSISYRAGWTECPPDIEQATILHAALSYYDRNRFGKTSQSLNGDSVAFSGGIVKSVIDGILDKYRRVRL